MKAHGFMSRERRGFALLAVLWIVAGIAAVAMATTLAARDAVDVARNRGALSRARWLAAGCLETARAAADGALRTSRVVAPGEGSWSRADTLLATLSLDGCTLGVSAAGDAIDVNAVDGDAIVAALLVAGADSARAIAMRDALLDWRDADTISRPTGAERAWYVAEGRTPPRNDVLAARAELALVRGWEDSTLRAQFDVEMGRAVLARASLSVLATLPGMSPQAAAQVVEARERGVRLTEVASLAYALAPVERAAVTSRVPELSARVAPEPDAWIVRATAGDVVRVTIEERWVRSGSRVAVVRHETMAGGGR